MADQDKQVPILSRLRPPAGAVRTRVRRGRGVGSGLGKTSGKGVKGQKARHPGGFSKLGFEGGQTPLYRRIPKRGFTNPFTINTVITNVGELKRFAAGTIVDEAALRSVGLIKGKAEAIKVLGEGDLDRKLTVRVHAVSASARTKIEAAGGTVELLEMPTPRVAEA